MALTPKKVAVADIVRVTGPLAIPDTLTLRDAATILLRKADEEETVVRFHFEFRTALPLDGAYGLKAVLDSRFSGLASTQGTTHQTMFGPIKTSPDSVSTPVGPNGETVDVPWGSYELPSGVTMNVGTNYDKQTRMPFFTIDGTCERRFLTAVNEIASALRAYLREHSLYRGKALRIQFSDPHNNEPFDEPEITFMDLSPFVESQAIFSDEITEEIRALVYSPMSSPRPKKIGVLLTGIPGVGKTLVLSIAARKAQDAGRTVIYCNSQDFTTALRFATNYAAGTGAVIVCEDIDRILSQERDASIDAIDAAIDALLDGVSLRPDKHRDN